MKTIWSSIAQVEINDSSPITEKLHKGHLIYFYLLSDGLWMVVRFENGARNAFRLAFSASDRLSISKLEEGPGSISFRLQGVTAGYKVHVDFLESADCMIHFQTELSPKMDLLMPFVPRDIAILNSGSGASKLSGKVHAHQVGARTGAIFYSMGGQKPGSVFYLQDLSSLADFCNDTKTSAADLVGGSWPEIGYHLPGSEEKALKKGKAYIVSDGYLLFSKIIPADNIQITQCYLDHLAAVYRVLPKPDTLYHDWLMTVEQGLTDLSEHKGCWTHAGGHSYLNAYVSDYKTPPEVMVQLAVLKPMEEYLGWKGVSDPMFEKLLDGLEAFYDDELGTIVRWLPALVANLDHSEEQKRERVMDSWYLHHPLLNLALLSKKGYKRAKDLLLKSVDYAIKVARHFDYNWPVFYRMDTLEIEKAETRPGAGGEKDVPGSYAHLMLEVWDITGEDKYLREAKKAALKLKGLSFDIFYQANNTAFAAGATLRLYKLTNDKTFLDISYACIAAIMKNVQIWDCNYGAGKHYPTFFSVFPLSDAPYTAAYEEQEVAAALDDYLKQAQGLEILPSVKLLCSEFVKYALSRIPFYYPPKLPEDILANEVKTGEVDPRLWIPLEDIHDGWESSGEVGQEVYGAGIGFGIIPRQYYRATEELLLFIEYPASGFRRSGKSISFFVHGDPAFCCRMLIMKHKKGEKPAVSTSRSGGKWKSLSRVAKTEFGEEYQICGDHRIRIDLK